MSKKIKILWLCNVVLSNKKSTDTGSWLHSMSELLKKSDNFELFNITQGEVKEITQQNFQSISQWLVPKSKLSRKGLPKLKIIKDIQKVVEDVKPDIIHIWGTENYWGLLYARGFIQGNILLEIQGLKFAIANYFYAGLTIFDIIRCFRLKEFIKPSTSLIGSKLAFERWGKFEKEMIMKIQYISTQSDWVRTYIKNVNADSTLFNTQIALRNEFVKATKWDIDKCVPYQIFTSSSSSSNSYKGLHILVDAVAIIKQRFPTVKLCIAGNLSKGIRMDGYSKWLLDKIKKKGIENNVTWLGSIDAENIIMQMHNANVVVIPSFIESYCLALDEALTIGAPTVVSFSSALTELAEHKKTALFYSPSDAEMCAHTIESYFYDRNLSISISESAYDEKKNKNNKNIMLSQTNIYKLILNGIV